MSKFLCFMVGLNVGLYAPMAINWLIDRYAEWKILRAETKLQKTLLEVKQKMQHEPLSNEFNKRKYEIAYNNKLERVKAKIKELENNDFQKQMAKMVTGMLITQTADNMVEQERLNNKLDDLYMPVDNENDL